MTATANIINFFGDLRSYNSFNRELIGSSHFHHDFALSFLNSKIWINSFKKLIKPFTCDVCFKDISTSKMHQFFENWFFPIMDAQKMFEPNHYGFICGSKFQHSSVNNRECSCFGFDGVDVKTSITVDVSRKISKIEFFHNVYSKNGVYHKLDFTVNDLASRIRKDMRKSELYGNIQREIRRGFPAMKVVMKSNRMPVLNSAAARLGQAMRETKDILQRDNLESSASVINCVGGANGRQIAVVKSDLIDLELLAA